MTENDENLLTPSRFAMKVSVVPRVPSGTREAIVQLFFLMIYSKKDSFQQELLFTCSPFSFHMMLSSAQYSKNFSYSYTRYKVQLPS